MVGSKAFDFYALSCGSLWKTVWNLIETAQRKSQDRSKQYNFRYALRMLCRTAIKSIIMKMNIKGDQPSNANPPIYSLEVISTE
jgi:hypothetical protein